MIITGIPEMMRETTAGYLGWGQGVQGKNEYRFHPASFSM